MTRIGIGLPVTLSLRLLENQIPQTGKTISVRAIDSLTAEELLASISVPETSEPGLYSTQWVNPPTIPTQAIVFYKDTEFPDIEFSEFITFEKLGDSPPSDQIANIVTEQDQSVIVELEGDEVDIVAEQDQTITELGPEDELDVEAPEGDNINVETE